MKNIKILQTRLVSGDVITKKNTRLSRAGTGFVAERLDWRGNWVVLRFEPKQTQEALAQCLEAIEDWQKLPF